jgi:hypothetical protein
MKRSRKKNVIPASRLDQLNGDSLIYEIRCCTLDCPCRNPEQGCWRGFFSLFLQAINGIAFSKRFRILYHVNFGHKTYTYSQPGRSDQNFWNYYFDQPIKKSEPERMVINELIETYPLRIWNRQYLRNLSHIMSKELVYHKEVSDGFNELKIKFQHQRVLGIHIRSTDHPDEILPVKIEDYFREINRRVSRFDKLFLATDDHSIAAQFSKVFGDVLWLNNVTRSQNGQALHADAAIKDKYQLGLDALMECYALSQCTEVLLTHSNLSYSALLFNPELRYKLMERLPTKLKRIKTLILYHLDKWNFRKW